MNKGDKVVFTYFFNPFDIGWGIGYYLFHLSPEQDPLRHHIVSTQEPIAGAVTNYEALVVLLENGSVQHKDVPFIYGYNIRPFSEALAKDVEKRYRYFTDRIETFTEYCPDIRQYYNKIERFSMSYPRLVASYHYVKYRYYIRKVINAILLPFKILTFEIRSVFTLHSEYIEKSTALKQRKKSRNPLIPYSEEERKEFNAETDELEKSRDKYRETLLHSNRAILGFILAIITLLFSQWFFRKTEVYLNERITMLQKENQLLKEEVNSNKHQLLDKQNENDMLRITVDRLKKKGK